MKFFEKFRKKEAEVPEQEVSAEVTAEEAAEAPAEEADGSKKKKKERKPLSKTKKIILICVAAVVLAGLIWGGVYAYNVLYKPQNVFDTLQNAPVKTPEPTTAQEDKPAEEVVEEPSDYELLMQNADTSIMQNIVNVAIIGVDYAPERDTWKGKKDFHADVIMILAINFDEKTVDMISIPRDTYAKIPGVDGIYKINASIDCGGGWPTEGGFNKVCEAAEWMLGGVPVDYYYAVSMTAVKQLVDAVGGVDFDLDMDFTLAGRKYTEGYQHMDGQAVLDYLRVRKGNLTGKKGDLNRINRQKEMLVAIFNKLKSSNLLVKIPDILEAFEGQLYTNTTFQQTAALALFAYDSLDSDNITMRSMDGTMGYGVFNWNFCLTNQKKRVEIIKEVYGIDVKQYKEYSNDAAWKKWYGMLKPVYTATAERVLAEADQILTADRLLATPSPSPTPEVTPTPAPPATTPAPPADTPTAPADTPAPPADTPAAPAETPAAPPADTPAENTEPVAEGTEPAPAAELGAKLGGTQLTAKTLTGGEAAPAVTTGRKYSEVEDQLYEAALAAYTALKETDPAKGDYKVTKQKLEAVYNSTIALAQALNIKVDTRTDQGKDWHYEYESSKNEIKVDFR